jgi:ABC-type Na+ transport system ATPase subunit NatA
MTISLTGLTKRYGATAAVQDISLRIAPGKVTGFLGPNGSGKSTTIRMILGLDRPTSGTALIDGRPYAELRDPLRSVGALVDAKAVHPGRSARNHLRAMACSNGIPDRRVGEVLEIVGLTQVARKRAGTFSLGMSQRLGIAEARILRDAPIAPGDRREFHHGHPGTHAAGAEPARPLGGRRHLGPPGRTGRARRLGRQHRSDRRHRVRRRCSLA